MGLIKCQDVCVGMDLLFLIVIFLMLVTPYFPWAAVISNIVAKACAILLTTPFDKDMLYTWSCGIFSFWGCFQPAYWLFTSTSKFLLRVSLTFLGVPLVEIRFSMRKGENFPRQISSKDSLTMNLEKFAASFSVFNSDKFIFVFC